MLDKHIIDKINDGHREIVRGSKDLVQKAIIVGEEIIRAREIAGHGEFGKLIDSGLFDMKKSNVYNYIKVAEYSAKVHLIGNLQEAYKLVAEEESKKKQAESANQRERIQYRIENNEKPDTWQRSDDYAWKKIQDERIARDERIAIAKEKMASTVNTNAQIEAETKQAFDALGDYFAKEQHKLDDLRSMRVNNQNSNILQIIEDYLYQVEDTDKKIEECYNIIKFCKHKAIELHQRGE